MNNVHQCQRDDVVLNGWIFVRLCRYTNFRKLVAVGLIDGWCLNSHVESNIFAAFEENRGVREDA